MNPLSGQATKVWFLLALVILIEAATILVVLRDDTGDTVVDFEQRVKALEGSAASAKDDASDLSKRVERVESQFWE